MAAMEAAAVAAGQDQQPPAKAVERLNPALQQQLNLDSVKTRAISLFKAISRILEELDAIARANATPKWQDVLGQFSMVNLELYNIVEDIKNVSKAFVVYPKNVNAENATILPVMLSSKLLPEMETEDNTKREQLLHGMQGLPVAAQIEKLKTRIDMIGAACESAEKIIADARKSYFSTRHGTNLLPTIDKVQATKIQEQENLLRSAVNHGEGLQVPGDQRQVASSLPMHLVDVLATNDSLQDSSGLYQKSTPPLMSTTAINNQGSLLQASGAQLIGRPAASPSGPTGSNSFDNNTTASPMQYANSPRSGANIMNTPSPQQQQSQQQQQQQQQLQQRQKMLQQQFLSQQQLRPSSMPVLGQNQLTQLHEMPSQSQQKFQSMHGQHHVQFSQPVGAQQLQSRQLTSAAMQHISPNQMNQGNQLNRQLNQFSSPAKSALFNAAQATPTSQMIPNMSAMMPSQSVMPRMQYAMSGANRTLPPQNLSDQMFNMGAANTGGGMMQIQQQQQHGAQGAFGNMQQSGQNMQPGMMTMQNTQQNHPNFQQQRPQNQQ
ncbi:mediator of RNA polymerase II transcription subunit 8-like isoform X2 [Salvia splendens]|uniref:mediator of RNA polymerase II transcription subunit 8-like isoform X2 n=1 Tax=Salvia splendens TaxID=180675 RepID=UPI001C27DCE5|nr:mediator of RNA polymerase II transcription subunit 8-like isoform X2 [Salvia splendens]